MADIINYSVLVSQ